MCVQTHIECDRIPPDLPLALPMHIQGYRVLDLTSSTLVCISFPTRRLLVLRNIRTELEIITHSFYSSLYMQQYQSKNIPTIPSSIENLKSVKFMYVHTYVYILLNYKYI